MSMIRTTITAPLLGLAALALVACAAPGGPAPQSALSAANDKLIAQDYPGARDAFLAIIAEDPNNAYAHLNLGVAYEELGEVELAKTHYNLAIQTGGSSPIAGTVEDGVVSGGVSTTVGALATQNLTALGG